MSIEFAILNIAVAAVWGCATAVYISWMKRKIQRQAVENVAEIYGKGLVRFAQASSEICPGCAHACDGYMCDKVDVYNFVRFGKCTNYEEKRF